MPAARVARPETARRTAPVAARSRADVQGRPAGVEGRPAGVEGRPEASAEIPRLREAWVELARPTSRHRALAERVEKAAELRTATNSARSGSPVTVARTPSPTRKVRATSGSTAQRPSTTASRPAARDRIVRPSPTTSRCGLPPVATSSTRRAPSRRNPTMRRKTAEGRTKKSALATEAADFGRSWTTTSAARPARKTA